MGTRAGPNVHHILVRAAGPVDFSDWNTAQAGTLGLALLLGGAAGALVRMREKPRRGRLQWPLLGALFAAAAVPAARLPEIRWVTLASIVGALALALIRFILALKALINRDAQVSRKMIRDFLVVYIMMVLAFGFLYYTLDPTASHRFFRVDSPTDPFVDFLYFSLVTAATIGYGDVAPITLLSKLLVMVQMVFGYAFLSILVGMIVSWIGTRPQTRRNDRGGSAKKQPAKS